MHQFTIHHSSFILHPSSLIQLPACKKSARNSSPHHHIITSSHHLIIQLPTSSMQKICENLRKEFAKIFEKLIIPSSHHHSITSFAFISGFSSTKFSGVRLGINRSERSSISTKKARYNSIIIGFCSERTEYKLKG